MPARRTHRRSTRRGRTSRIKSRSKSPVSKQLRRRLRNVALGVVVVISSICLFFFLSIWQALHFPKVKAGEQLSSGPLDLSQRTNVLLLLLDESENEVPQVKSINLLSLNPIDSTASMISIPSGLELGSLTNLGEVKLESLYALGKMRQGLQDQNAEEDPKETSIKPVGYMVSVLEKALAIKIDKFILTDEKGLQAVGEVVNEEMKWDSFDNLFSLFHLSSAFPLARVFQNHVQTDLSGRESFTLLKFMLSLRSDKIQKLEISEKEMKEPQLLDVKLVKHVADDLLYQDRLSVQVLNGTVTKGVAQKTSRYIENLGGRVVGIGNTTEQGSERSYILARDTSAYTVVCLSRLFGITEVREYSEVYGIKDRADVSVVIGLDLAQDL